MVQRLITFFVLFAFREVAAFMAPQPFLASSTDRIMPTTTTTQPAMTTSTLEIAADLATTATATTTVSYDYSTFWMADALGFVGAVVGGILSAIGGLVQTIVFLAALPVLFFAGAYFVYTAFIIPQTLQELEQQAKELNAPLWEQIVEGQLREGEKLADRPDLIQELGVALQPYLEKRIALEQQAETNTGFFADTSPPWQRSTSTSTNNAIVDVEVIVEDDDNNNNKGNDKRNFWQ